MRQLANAMVFDDQKQIEFSAIRLKLASPETMLGWSFGEVMKPETINYRTQKPEKSGLFAEEIFGPTKDWECYCGKYKRIRYKGIICDKCGVEVTRSIVRRERMGHIKLAAPVSHIWFLRGVPSKIGLALDLSVQDLEKVIYFANYIITKVDDGLRQETLKQIETEEESKRKQIEGEIQRAIQDVQLRKTKEVAQAAEGKRTELTKRFEEELTALTAQRQEQLKTLQDAAELAKRELKGLAPLQIITEQQYHDLSLKYGHVFEASIGAESIHQLLDELDLDAEIKRLDAEVEVAAENRKRRLLRRLKLFKNFKKNRIRPEWMILTVIPVIPPDLRPMVQLDGGRFAASDLNDLYRRVINRNNRLKRLIELNAPEVICRNEKRMLQEAVDALIDNSARHGKTVTASTGQKRQLKSIADMLKGKQGRFRQNLLGKRVDYSGRSVIVVGPKLKLHQCGLPKTMALELFKPFVISQLIKREFVHNVRSATRFIDGDHAETWDILEEITRDSNVLLNRAPTLHRLGIQAFQPILIEGKAIQVHPLVCPAFNADFDGDQMAVHVPLTEQAKWEAKELMLSTKNLLKPATGTPVVTPSQDVVLGCFYLTHLQDDGQEESKRRLFGSADEAILAFDIGLVQLRQPIRVKLDGALVTTTPGRIIFNRVLPPDWPYLNEVLDKPTLSRFVSEYLRIRGREETVALLDAIKTLAFEYLTRSGISWGMDDLTVPKEKREIIRETESAVEQIHAYFESGLLTDEERHTKVIEIWDQAKTKIQEASRKALDRNGPVYAMIASRARGSWEQTTQMMGMKGLVTNPAGEIIELPVKGSFKEGFDVLEYFISTHGARKGLSDTALRTANAGYLTRRLIDVAQDVVVTEEDCGDTEGIVITKEESEEMSETLATRLVGRFVLAALKDGRKTVVKAGGLVLPAHEARLKGVALESARMRSILTCKTLRGVCQKCYGIDLGNNELVALGTAVGIIAAQSIGEPGTQLTMRTFHTGGVAGQDITQGLPRVEELFEARPVKKPALMAEVGGKVSVVEQVGQAGAAAQKVISISFHEEKVERHELTGKDWHVLVKSGDRVSKGQPLAAKGKEKIVSRIEGEASVGKNAITVTFDGKQTKEYVVPPGYAIWVKDGETVERGDELTEGNFDLQQLYHLKGQIAVQKYIMKEIQYIYSSQGQKLNDKHVEVIVRQMFSRVYIRDGGDTELLPGDIAEHSQFTYANASLPAGKKPVVGETLLLGITKASLSIDSFLSAASFQETARVLIDAAVSGKVDRLRGLKENVIIGKLIPAGTGFRKMPK